MKRLQFVFLIFLSFSLLSWIGLHDEVKNHPILGPLLEKLDKYGIDAHSNWKTVDRAKIRRTTIAPLNSSYPVNATIALNQYSNLENLKQEWEKEFKNGTIGALVANEKSSSGVSFRKRWGVPKGKRVFISYAGEDNEKAILVKKILDNSGYNAYTYLNSKGKVRFDPKTVGQFFFTADYVFVIDTEIARNKNGVILEVELAKEIEKRLQQEKDAHLKEIEKLEKGDPAIRMTILQRAKRVEILKNKVRRIERIEKRRIM